VICTQPCLAPARVALAVAYRVLRIHGAQPVLEVVQLLPESFPAGEGRPQPCGEAKAAIAAALGKPFGISPKEGFFWSECSAAEIRRRQPAAQSGAVPEETKGQRQQGQEPKRWRPRPSLWFPWQQGPQRQPANGRLWAGDDEPHAHGRQGHGHVAGRWLQGHW